MRLKQDAVPGRVIKGWLDANAAGVYEIQCAEICGIGHGLMGRRHSVVNKGVHSPRLFGADIGLQLEILDLARDLAGHGRGVKLADGADARLAGEQSGPGLGDGIAHRADATEPGDDNAATSH